MIVGIGTDIVEIDRIRKLTERFGDRIGKRILTDNEWQVYIKRNHSVTYLASRFAAKEAASKALGTGIAEGISFHSMEVIKDDAGKPLLRFLGKGLERIAQMEVTHSHISLSDEKRYAVAMVVLER